jgi:hypothetical protein
MDRDDGGDGTRARWIFLSTRLCRYPSRVSRAFGEATGSSRANEQFEFDRLTPLFTSVQGV